MDFSSHPTIAPLLADATSAIQAVHRRPVSLRKPEITGAESVLQGAKLASLLGDFSVDTAIDAYSVLAPGACELTVRTYLRAPLQVLARVDVLAGGSGKPANPQAAQHLMSLAKVITSTPGEQLLPAVVLGEILKRELFGDTSWLVGLVTLRLTLVGGGVDPAGLTVPEVYFGRRKAQLLEAVAEYPVHPTPLFSCYLQALIAGAEQAERIAAAAS
jgi:hypothetical protein